MAEEAESSSETTEAALDNAETLTEDVDAPSPGKLRASVMVPIEQLIDHARAHSRSILLLALVIATMGLATGLFFFQYRPDREVDDQAANQAVRAASDGAVALLSYSSDSLDRDLAEAKTHLTGNFLGQLLWRRRQRDRPEPG